MSVSQDVVRYSVWASAVAGGGLFAVADKNWIGRPVLGFVLAAVAIAGAIGMEVSPFKFGGTSYYMESLIAMAGALLALAGYACVAAWSYVRSRMIGGGK